MNNKITDEEWVTDEEWRSLNAEMRRLNAEVQSLLERSASSKIAPDDGDDLAVEKPSLREEPVGFIQTDDEGNEFWVEEKTIPANSGSDQQPLAATFYDFVSSAAMIVAIIIGGIIILFWLGLCVGMLTWLFGF